MQREAVSALVLPLPARLPRTVPSGRAEGAISERFAEARRHARVPWLREGEGGFAVGRVGEGRAEQIGHHVRERPRVLLKVEGTKGGVSRERLSQHPRPVVGDAIRAEGEGGERGVDLESVRDRCYPFVAHRVVAQVESFELDVRREQFRDLGGTKGAEVVVKQLERSQHLVLTVDKEEAHVCHPPVPQIRKVAPEGGVMREAGEMGVEVGRNDLFEVLPVNRHEVVLSDDVVVAIV
mmetsp:Transcript_34248/g.78145  ORF Transcript_34248/g.78145 Transcript_34248/m.78145 type:complete len:237 (+) Transcript_34248:525-1235(+)